MVYDISQVLEFSWNWYALPSLVAFIINGFLAGIILVRYREQQTVTSALYVMFTVCLAIWSLGEALQRLSGTQAGAGFWGVVASTGWVFMAPLFFHFSLAFSKNKTIAVHPLLPVVLYFPAGIFYFLSLTTSFLVDPESFAQVSWGWNSPPTQFFNFVFSPWLELFFITALIIFIRQYLNKKSGIEERKRAGVMALGLLVPLVSGTVTQIILPIFGIYVVGLSTLFLPVLAVAVLVAMLRYRLFIITPASALSATLDSIGDLVIVTDSLLAIQFVNRAATRVFAGATGELVGTHMAALFSPQTSHWNLFKAQVIEKVLKGDTVEHFETIFQDKTGHELPVSVSAAAVVVPQEGAESQGVVVVGRSLAEIRSLIRELETRSQELSAAKSALEQQFTKTIKANTSS